MAWLTEARGLSTRSEGLGWPGPVDKSEGFRWAGLAQALSIKVRALGGRAGPGPVYKSEGLGRPGLAQGLSINVRGWGAGPAQGWAGAKPFRGLRPCLVPPLGYKIDVVIWMLNFY